MFFFPRPFLYLSFPRPLALIPFPCCFSSLRSPQHRMQVRVPFASFGQHLRISSVGFVSLGVGRRWCSRWSVQVHRFSRIRVARRWPRRCSRWCPPWLVRVDQLGRVRVARSWPPCDAHVGQCKWIGSAETVSSRDGPLWCSRWCSRCLVRVDRSG